MPAPAHRSHPTRTRIQGPVKIGLKMLLQDIICCYVITSRKIFAQLCKAQTLNRHFLL